MEFLFLSSNQFLRLTSLTNEQTGNLVNDATVVWTITHGEDVIGTGSMDSTGSDGNYSAVVADLELELNEHYLIVVTVNDTEATFYEEAICIEDTGIEARC